MSNGNPSDRRHFGRRDSTIKAIVHVRGRASLDCTLLNYSATGALIEFRESTPIAQMFHLIITEKNIDLLCQVRHRTPRTLGVAFVGGSVEQFVVAFRPQPLAPIDPPATVASRLDNVDLPQTPSRPDPIIETNDPLIATACDESPNTAPAGPCLEDLFALLDSIPEFTEAGFRMEPSETSAELAIYHRAIRRGVWLESEGSLIWLPTGMGLEPVEVASADKAALVTMQMILSILQRRRRALASVTDVDSEEKAHSAA